MATLQRRLFRALVPLALAASAFGQYKAESAGAPPADIPASVGGLLQKQGTKITDSKGDAVYEIWLVSALPSGPKSSEANLTLPEVPHGSVMGVIKVDKQILDRRGDQMKPGLYTMRYSYFPVNGAHQGVAPQRDFLVLLSAAGDQDAKTNPDFATLMKAAEKTSGIAHPYVLSLWKQDESDFKQGFDKYGDKDWTLQQKVGTTPVAIILVGQAET